MTTVLSIMATFPTPVPSSSQASSVSIPDLRAEALLGEQGFVESATQFVQELRFTGKHDVLANLGCQTAHAAHQDMCTCHSCT